MLYIFVSMIRKVLFDPGHGCDCSGKCSPYYFREYEWCREIAAGCVSSLLSVGIDAEMLVTEERDIPLAERTRRANEWCNRFGKSNVLLVSVHNNAAGDQGRWMTARGWAAYTTKGMTESDKLAEEIIQVAESEFKAPLKVRKYIDKYFQKDYEENFYILRNTLCPAVLIENFFQDNREDVLYLKSDTGKGSCIHVMTVGVENYINKYR